MRLQGCRCGRQLHAMLGAGGADSLMRVTGGGCRWWLHAAVWDTCNPALSPMQEDINVTCANFGRLLHTTFAG